MSDKIDLHVSDIPKFAAFYAAHIGIEKDDNGEFDSQKVNEKIRTFYEDCIYVSTAMEYFASQDNLENKMRDMCKCLPLSHDR